jgi:hydroxymethylpyrimidine pyrophosphatase-like HAD family hydrolase
VKLGQVGAARLEAALAQRGVTAVRSSVHVNCWLGRFDKLTAARRFLEVEWGSTLRARDPRYVYVGDSFNDAPMFGAFALSVGVANVLDVVDQLAARPAFITRAREGHGFTEVAELVGLGVRRTS